MAAIESLDLDIAPLLAWTDRRGEQLDRRAAEAVVGLLALSGARRRTGLPEPTPELAEELLLSILPLFASAAAGELQTFPAVLVALAGYTHEAGRLNSKRRDRLINAVGTLAPRFEAAMTSPRRVTWARLYGQLLRAEGVDPGDSQAVGDWLTGFGCQADQVRWACLGLDAPGDYASPDSAADPPLAWAAFVRSLIGERSRQARLLLRQRLEVVARSEQLSNVDQRPLFVGVPGDEDGEEAAEAWYDAQARRLADRWTAAGLDALLSARTAELAPGLDRPAPLLDVVEQLAQLHLDMYGPGTAPLPPVPALGAGELAAVVRAVPTVTSLAAAAADPANADPSLADLALTSGFLLRDVDGTLRPGPAAGVCRDGGPAEVVGVTLDVLGAVLGQLQSDDQTAEEIPGDHVGTLYSLYQRGGLPQSLARQVAEEETWMVPPESPVAPTEAAAPAGPYQIPDARSLSDLTGIPGLTEEDRSDLQAPAERLAAVIDRLADLGVTSRAGDTIVLTPLGCALLREALLLGAAEPSPVDAASFPTRDEVLCWDAGRLADAAGDWPPPTARKVLCDWLAARGAAGWAELFSVLGAAPPDDITPARRRLMRWIDLSDAPAEALRDTVTDRILGAWAERALHERGLPVPAAEVPASARAVLLADELADVNRAAMLTYRMTDEHPDQDPGLLPELRAAVGKAVAVWPGGATDLFTEMGEAAPDAFAVLAGPLSRHPDSAVAQAAEAARTHRKLTTSTAHRRGQARSRATKSRAKRRKGHR